MTYKFNLWGQGRQRIELYLLMKGPKPQDPTKGLENKSYVNFKGFYAYNIIIIGE